MFYPETGRSASGTITDGQITEVTTYNTGDGAPIGSHRVSVVSFTTDGEGTQAVTKSLIPEKYGNPDKSGLSATVEAGKQNVIDLELTD